MRKISILRVRKAAMLLLLAGAGIAAGCRGSSVDGQYRDSDGTVNIGFKNGKASMNVAGVLMDGTYEVSGNAITIHPTTGNLGQSLVFTINKDNSIDGPAGVFPRLQKQK